jgi:NADH-quinone oxidoreductase subunit N
MVTGEDTAKQNIGAFAGLFWHRPLEASALTVAMLSLAGIPLTAGFMAKFFVITVGIQSGLWGLLAVLIVASAIAIYYYLRIIFAMTKSAESPGNSANWQEKIVALALMISILVLGAWPQPFIAYAGLL